jgi:hypothetical protein
VQEILMTKQEFISWITKQEFIKRHPYIKEGQLTRWLFHRDKNGLGQYVRKVGKVIFISEPGFDEWIDQYGKQA